MDITYKSKLKFAVLSKLAFGSLLFLAVFGMIAPQATSAIAGNGQGAIDALGQLTVSGGVNYNSNTVNSPMNVGMNGPSGAVIDTVRHVAYAVDTGNNRVLVYQLNTDNTFIDLKADFIVGQSSFSQTSANRGSGSPANNSLRTPSAVAVDAATGNVYVADTGNNRVLLFSTVTADDPTAQFVIGASDFTSNNNSGTVSQARMYSPSGIAFSGSGGSFRIYISDRDFNRVLIFGAIGANGQSATGVLGQSSFITSAAGLSQSALASPVGVAATAAGALYVADSGNNRVMIWNTSIASDGQSANAVIGQTWFYSNNAGTSATTMNRPQGVSIGNGNEVFVADTNNNRVMIWGNGVSVSGQAATLVLGQTNMTNSGAGTSPNRFAQPFSISNAGAYTLIADTQNNRIIGYSSSVTSTGQSASFALGQLNESNTVDFYSDTANNPQNYGLNRPSDIAIDTHNHKLFVSDSNNNRVLVYALDAANRLTSRSAEFVLGQTTFSNTNANQGGAAANNTLNSPQGLFYDSVLQRLYVADTGNNRVVVYTGEITENAQPAALVLGQSNFTSTNPSVTRSGLASPESVSVNLSTGAVAVADRDNNRVLVWSSTPVDNNRQADLVVGQANFTSAGFGLSANALHTPRGVAFDVNTGYLYVADSDNNRVMVWTAAILANNQNANRVIGQANMTSGTAGAVSATRLNQPSKVTVGQSSSVVYIADTGNNRGLVYKSTILVDGQAADTVVGQPNMTSGGAVTSQSGLDAPGAIMADASNGITYVADTQNNRITVYGNDGPAKPTGQLPADGAVGASSLPTFQMSGLDPDGDALQYRVEIARDAAFTTGVVIHDQTISPTGWAGRTIGNTYGLGSVAAFSLPIQDILSASTQYWWRVSSYDTFGTRTWSTFSDVHSFTTSSPQSIAFLTPEHSVTAGQPSPRIDVQLRDSNGQPVRSSANTRVYLTSSSGTGFFASSSSMTVPITYIDIPAGSSTASLYYQDSTVGNPMLTASDSTPPNGNVGLRDDQQIISITASVISSFVFSQIDTTTAGVDTPVSIAAIDAYGNTVTSFNGEVTLTSTNESPVPSTVVFAGGSWSGNVVLTKAGNVRIAAAYHSTNSSSAFFNVLPAAIASVGITPSGATIRSGTDTPLTATAYDAYENPITAGVAYSWSADAAVGTMVNPTQAVSSIRAGNTVTGGAIYVTATKETAVQSSTTVSVIPHHFEVSAIPSTITAGAPTSVTITARSSSGALIGNYNDTVTLDDQSDTIYPQTVTLSGGSWSGAIAITKTGENNKIAISAGAGSIVGESNAFTVAPAALSSVTAAPSTLSLSVNTSLPASAQALDQYGNQINTVTYNWSTTIGSINNTGKNVTFNAGSTSGSGTVTVSVTLGAETRTATIPVVVSSSSVDHFSFAIISEQTAGQSFQVTIFARDTFGNTVTNFNGNGLLSYSAGTINPASTTDFSNGTWSGSVRVTKAADVTSLNFISGSFSGTSNTFRVKPDDISTVAINPSSATIGLQQTQQFTATAYDAHANEITTGVTYSWTINDSQLASISPVSGRSTNMTTTTRAGATYVNVRAIEGEGSVTNSVLANVQHGPLDHFTFDTISSPQPTGELIGVKITARDAYDNVATSFNSTALLSDKTGTINPTQTTSFTDGIWSGYVRISNVHTRNQITITSGIITGVSNEFDVISNILDHVVITPSSSNVTVGQTQAFSAQGYDVFGNAITGLSYTWSVIGAAGSVSPLSGLATTFTASPATGAGLVRVSVSQGNVSKQVTAAVNVQAGALDHFLYTPMPNVRAGQSTYVTLTAKDMYDNTITSFSNDVTLSDDLNGIVPTNTGPFSQGVWTGQVSFQKSGITKINATFGAVRSHSDTFTVTPDQLYTAEINPTPVVVTAGRTQVLTGFGKDRFGNTVENVSYTWSVPSTVGTLSALDQKEVTLNASNRTTQATINLIVSAGPVLVSKSVDATVVSDVIAQFIIAQINSPQIAGTAFQVSAVAADQFGNTVTNFNQTATLTDGTGSISPTQTSNFANGSWNGPVTVTQTTDNNYITLRNGSVQSQSNQFSVEAGEQQVFLTVQSGANQSGSAGAKLGSPLSVKAVDLYNNPMPDVPIVFSIDSTPTESAGTTVAPATVTTDGEGNAMSELKLGNKTGTYVVTASIEGRSSVSVTFYASATSALTTSVKVSPSTTTLLTGSSQLFVAQAFDSFGNVIPNVTPEWSVVAGGGTITQEGIFTAGSVTRVYSNTVSATINGVTGYASVTITTLPGITGDNREGAGVVDRLVLTPIEPSVNVGTSIGFTAKAIDRYNQEVNPTDLSYTWEATGGSVDGSNAATATFTANESPQPASVTVRVAQASKQVTKSASTNINVKANPMGYLVVSAPKDTIVAGEEFQMTITAYRGDGTINTDFKGPVELSDSTQTVTPRITTEFSRGVWTGRVSINSGNEATVVKAAGQQVLGVSANIAIENKHKTQRSNQGGVLGAVYNFVASAGETLANFFDSFIKTSGSYPETTRNIAAGGVAALGFVAAAISFGKVASSGMKAIGRNPYARRKIYFSMLIAFIVSVMFAGLAFLIAGFIKFL